MSPVPWKRLSWDVEASALPPASAELVVVRLQQRLGDVPWLTAGQVLTGALLFWLTAAATAATSTVAAAAAAAAAWQVSIVLRWGEARNR